MANIHQYYVAEIQQYTNGEFGHIIHYGFDEDDTKARLKTESKQFNDLKNGD